MTRAAPAWSRQSVKPPVEAPTSTQSRPTTSTSNASSAFCSFSPPRETKRGGRSTSSAASSATCSPGLSCPGTSPASTSACACARDSASPRSTRSTSRRFLFVMPLRARPSALTRACPRRVSPSPPVAILELWEQERRLDAVRRCRRHAGRMMTPTRLLPATKRRARRRRSRTRTRPLAPGRAGAAS